MLSSLWVYIAWSWDYRVGITFRRSQWRGLTTTINTVTDHTRRTSLEKFKVTTVILAIKKEENKQKKMVNAAASQFFPSPPKYSSINNIWWDRFAPELAGWFWPLCYPTGWFEESTNEMGLQEVNEADNVSMKEIRSGNNSIRWSKTNGLQICFLLPQQWCYHNIHSKNETTKIESNKLEGSLFVKLLALSDWRAVSHADMSYINMSYVNVSYAKLSYVNIRYVNVSYVNMSYLNMSYVNTNMMSAK